MADGAAGQGWGRAGQAMPASAAGAGRETPRFALSVLGGAQGSPGDVHLHRPLLPLLLPPLLRRAFVQNVLQARQHALGEAVCLVAAQEARVHQRGAAWAAQYGSGRGEPGMQYSLQHVGVGMLAQSCPS